MITLFENIADISRIKILVLLECISYFSIISIVVNSNHINIIMPEKWNTLYMFTSTLSHAYDKTFS